MDEKTMENDLETGIIWGYIGDMYFIWGYYGTQYRVRLYPPFGV